MWYGWIQIFRIKLFVLTFAHNEKLKIKKTCKFFVVLYFSKYTEKVGHSVGKDTIFTRSEQSVKNTTSWLSAPIIHFIAQRKAFTSVCRGNRLRLRFVAPIIGIFLFVDVQCHHVSYFFFFPWSIHIATISRIINIASDIPHLNLSFDILVAVIFNLQLELSWHP